MRSTGRRGAGSASSAGSASPADAPAEERRAVEAHKRDDNTIGEEESPFHRPRWHRAYSFGLITGAFFVISWIGQFITQMMVVRNDAAEHNQAFEWSGFLSKSSRPRSRTGSRSSSS